MESLTSGGINSLPSELLPIIHSNLPLEDQIFTMPKVSKIWHSISEENQNFKELAKSFLERSIKSHGYNDEQIDTIIKWCKTNDFISNIKKDEARKYASFMGGSIRIVSEKEKLKNSSVSGIYRKSSGCSNFFKINWNPNTLKLSTDKGKWGDFRSSFAISVGALKLQSQQKNIFKSFELGAYSAGGCERGDLISWKHIKEEEIKPEKMNKLINDAFDLQLKMYIYHLTNMNMVALSEINSIEDIKSGLDFLCNKNGRITHKNEANSPILTIKIENIEVYEIIRDMPVLIWDSSDYSESKEEDCKVEDLMRWSVFSSTCEKLAEKLGIRIRGKGL